MLRKRAGTGASRPGGEAYEYAFAPVPALFRSPQAGPPGTGPVQILTLPTTLYHAILLPGSGNGASGTDFGRILIGSLKNRPSFRPDFEAFPTRIRPRFPARKHYCVTEGSWGPGILHMHIQSVRLPPPRPPPPYAERLSAPPPQTPGQQKAGVCATAPKTIV